MQGLIVDQYQLGNKDLGSLTAALYEAWSRGCRIWQLPNLGEGHRFGGKSGGWLSEWDHSRGARARPRLIVAGLKPKVPPRVLFRRGYEVMCV